MIKLLVVDDEPGVCDTIEKTFTYIGFSVLTATNSKKALGLFKKEKPKIVFLDMLKPKEEGIGLLREMKNIDAGTNVIVLSESGQESYRKEAQEAGADEFIAKPFSRNYLRDVAVEKIKSLLEKRGQMQKPTVLIVDDERETCELLTDFLSSRFECDVEASHDATDALRKVEELKPDIVLLDIKMPGISGLQAIAEIKKFSPDSRVIVVSAWKSMEVVNEAVKKGASDYLSKPVSQSALDEKLRASLISLGKLIVKKT